MFQGSFFDRTGSGYCLLSSILMGNIDCLYSSLVVYTWCCVSVLLGLCPLAKDVCMLFVRQSHHSKADGDGVCCMCHRYQYLRPRGNLPL